MEEIPRGYVHQNVGAQIERYRNAYQDALDAGLLNKHDDNFLHDGEVPGLRDIAIDGFRLTHDVLLRAKNKQSDEVRDEYRQVILDRFQEIALEELSLRDR